MPDSRPAAPPSSDAAEAALSNYRSVSWLAVLGLILGLLSALALWHPILWFLPILGLVANGLALQRIGAAPEVYVGRGLAVAGMALTLLFGVAGPVSYGLWYRRLVNDAGAAAEQWFADLRADEPERAYQMRLGPMARYGPDEEIWDFYQEPANAQELRGFVDQPVVRALLALGDRAQVRRFATVLTNVNDRREKVYLVYAVTFRNDDDQLQTFLVSLDLERQAASPPGPGSWQVRSAGLVDSPPEEWADGSAARR